MAPSDDVELLKTRIEARYQSLLKAVATMTSARLAGDGRVDPATAARLLGRSPRTLANWRTMAQGPPFFRVGGRRVSYDLHDLALFIEMTKA